MLILYVSPHNRSVFHFLIDFRPCDPEMRSKLKILNYYSTFILKPVDLKLYDMILDKRLHVCSTVYQNFLIFGHVTQKWDQRSKYWIVIATSLSNRWIWKIYMVILNKNPRWQCVRYFYFRSCDPQLGQRWKYWVVI